MALQHVPRDLAHVEQGGKQVVLKAIAQLVRFRQHQAAGDGRIQVRQHGHHWPRARVILDDTVYFAVNAAVDGVDQAVAPAAAGVLQERGRENPLAAGREHDLHGVIHPAGHNRLDHAAVGLPPKDVRRPCDERLPARPRVGLLGKGPLAPINPAVGPEVGAVQIVGAAGERLARKPLLAAVGDAVAVDVGQLPDARRRGDIQRAIVPQNALGKHHLIGEDDAPIEPPVAVGIRQPDDAVWPLLELRVHVFVGAARVGHIESPRFIVVG